MIIYILNIGQTDYRGLKNNKYADRVIELKKINMLRNEDDKKRSLGAGLLLLDILAKEYGYDYEFICDKLTKTESGKPYLTDGNVRFSLSHSGDYIAVAVGKHEVGVDVERIRKLNEKVMDRCFTDNEKKTVGKNDEEYTTVWTLKESYVKLTGTGITSDLKKYNTEYNGQKKYYCNMLAAFFANFKIEDYCFSICSNNEFEYKIKYVHEL